MSRGKKDPSLRVSPLPTLGEREFTVLSRLVQGEAGIKMPLSKKALLEGRLRRRLKARGMGDFSQYIRFLFEEGGLEEEIVPLLDAVTTNKTDFYREPQHFRFLAESALPRLAPPGEPRFLRVWSAGCSSGEEAYTLGMVLGEHRERCAGFDFSILGTDISTRVLEKAQAAIYPRERVEPLPLPWQRRYLMRGKDWAEGLVRVVPELRNRVRLARLNFQDPEWGGVERMDVIFCRNVLIYFERPFQIRIVGRLLDQLEPGGFLFLGHAEMLHGSGLGLRPVGPMVYRKDGN